MRWLFLFSFLALICLACTACGAEPLVEAPALPLASPYPLLASTSTRIAPASTPSVTSPAPRDRPPTTAVSEQQATVDLLFAPCSPLAEHSLGELPEIVSAPYDPPPMGSDARHQGVDFSYYRRGERLSILGVGVQSIFTGRVAAAIADRFPYGNVVIIETPVSELPPVMVERLGIQEGESLYTLYAHMGAAPLIALGDPVTACNPLGEVGKSGNAGVPHLHLEMRIGPANSQFVSMAFYSTQTTQQERDNYVLWRMSGEFRHLDPMSVFAP